ncbi:MAG: hypothetical protein ACRCXZ_09545 [Patescibacteria group bacterium]
MTQINNLNRKFIVRVSHKNRKVNYLTKPIKTNLPLSKEVKDRLATPQIKTTDIAAFPIKNEFREKIPKLKLKKGTFYNATAVYRYMEVLLESKEETSKNVTGTVIEVVLKKDGDIFKESMLFFTNQTNLSVAEIKEVYHNYLRIFGIEQVFKFMKDTLNLKGFAIQDFESIKKLIAITFFAAAYMYLNKTETIDDPVLINRIKQICYLGYGKGVIGLKFLKQGLQKLESNLLVSKWQKEFNISDEELIEIARYFGLLGIGKSVKV